MDFKADIGNDCAFHIENKGPFCAPEEVVDKLKEKFDEKEDDELLDKLKDKFQCETEICILEHPEVKNEIGHEEVSALIETSFKPEGPRETTAWLSNIEIDAVLDQMEKKYSDKKFLHIPFQMIDFEQTGSELARLDWPKKYEEGYRCFGAVLNTDTSKGRGIHWFSIFCSCLDSDEKFTIEYFNSSGSLPMHQVANWMKRVKHEWQPYFKNDKRIEDITVTRLVNQEDDFSCGSYSLYYIISRLDGTPYEYFKHNKIGDDNMLEFRKYLFRR